MEKQGTASRAHFNRPLDFARGDKLGFVTGSKCLLDLYRAMRGQKIQPFTKKFSFQDCRRRHTVEL